MKKLIVITKAILLIFFTIIIIISSFYVYAYITPKTNIYTNDSIIYYDINENNIFEYSNNNYVKLEDISDHVKEAIILELCKVESLEKIKNKAYYNLMNNWDKVLEKCTQ